MNPGMIRLGGILVFVSLALSIVGLIAMAAMTPMKLHPTLGIAAQVAGTALFVYVLLSTKALFNQHDYHGADFPIFAILGLSAVNLVVNVVDGNSLNEFMTEDGKLKGSLSALAIVSLAISAVVCALTVWFAIAVKRFGNRVDSGIWKAVGILYLVAYPVFALAIALLFVGIASGFEGLSGLMIGLMIVAGIAALAAGLAIIASWICQGIGLIMGSQTLLTRQANS